MTLFWMLLGTACTLLLSAFFSGLETAAYSASPARLRAFAADGSADAKRALGLQRRIAALITTILIGNNIVNYMGTYFITSYLEGVVKDNVEFFATVVTTPVFFLFGEILPKRAGHGFSETFVMAAARVARLLQIALRPPAVLLGAVGFLLRKGLALLGLSGQAPTGRTHLLATLEAEMLEGTLTSEQMTLAKQIIELEKKTVGQVMVPTDNVVAVREDAPCREAAARMTESGYNRILLTDASGQLTGKLLPFSTILRNAKYLDQPVSMLAIDAMRLPQATTVAVAVEKMRERGARVAIVTGTGATALGIVTNGRLLGCFLNPLRKR